MKSFTYIPKYSGDEPGIMVPEYKYGAFGDGRSSIDARTFLDFSYQCIGEHFKPYNVLISRR